MKKVILGLVAILAMMLLSGCNEQVPAGTKGKILGKNGWQPEIYPPSKVWVDTAFTTTPEKLFLIQTTTTQKYVQPIKVLLKDKLTLKAEIVFRGRINGSDKVINSIFNDLPIEISDVTVGNIEYPKIVTMAIESAKERRMAIEKEQAQVQIELTKKEGQEAIAKADYRIKMLEAKRIRDYNAMTAKGITKDLIELRRLELREKELDKWDGHYPLNATTVMGTAASVIVDTK